MSIFFNLNESICTMICWKILNVGQIFNQIIIFVQFFSQRIWYEMNVVNKAHGVPRTPSRPQKRWIGDLYDEVESRYTLEFGKILQMMTMLSMLINTASFKQSPKGWTNYPIKIYGYRCGLFRQLILNLRLFYKLSILQWLFTTCNACVQELKCLSYFMIDYISFVNWPTTLEQ